MIGFTEHGLLAYAESNVHRIKELDGSGQFPFMDLEQELREVVQEYSRLMKVSDGEILYWNEAGGLRQQLIGVGFPEIRTSLGEITDEIERYAHECRKILDDYHDNLPSDTLSEYTSRTMLKSYGKFFVKDVADRYYLIAYTNHILPGLLEDVQSINFITPDLRDIFPHIDDEFSEDHDDDAFRSLMDWFDE